MRAANNCSDDKDVDTGRSVTCTVTSPSFLQEASEKPSNLAVKKLPTNQPFHAGIWKQDFYVYEKRHRKTECSTNEVSLALLRIDHR
jgi:hypothetical protein